MAKKEPKTNSKKSKTAHAAKAVHPKTKAPNRRPLARQVQIQKPAAPNPTEFHPHGKLVVQDNKINLIDEQSLESIPDPSQSQSHSVPAVMPGKQCPSCRSDNLIYDRERGELVCNNCGLVIEENITDLGQEWRAFDSDQRNSRARTGAPMKYTKANKGLVTEIDLYNKDIRGVRVPSKRHAQLYRMKKWHKRASIASSSERNYLIALPELNRVASYLGLPENIRENAALLYRRCVQNNFIRGRPIETVVQAVIYAACRKAGMPRTLDEIASISGLPKKEVGRAYRAISHGLNLKIPLTDPISYVPRYVSALKLSAESQEEAVKLLKSAMKKGLVSGRSPTGVSAAAVYIAGAIAGERRTQKEVADVAGVTEVTIRNRYRELKEQLNIDVNL
jgi:Transcription initiation factor IIB (TFIIB)